jgi:hypothetical protein
MMPESPRSSPSRNRSNRQPIHPAAGPTCARDYVERIPGTEPRPSPASPEAIRAAATATTPRRGSQPRSTWERITLHPDIELHVRRPLARADQRRLDELLEHARRLFPGNL